MSSNRVMKNNEKKMLKNLQDSLKEAIKQISNQQHILDKDNQNGGGKDNGNSEVQNKPKPKPKAKKRRRKLKIKAKTVIKTCEELVELLKSSISDIEKTSEDYNRAIKCMEEKNAREISESGDNFEYLYPHLDDSEFNQKLVKKKEFSDTKYEEKSKEDYENIVEISDKLCQVREFELEPHQMFVRNFLSFQTPYNSLLLYHGLGTGKTCSAIGVCEEMRTYLNQMGINKRIIIVASPAVQENFKLQLFDESKLKLINGEWNIYGCTGNKLIKEINPMNMKGLERTKIVKQIKRIISQSYLFLGYIQFANYISRIMDKYKVDTIVSERQKKRMYKAIDKEFSNRLIVIDEAHNIRTSDSKELKRTSDNLLKLVKYTDSLKLLLLSATPMFDKAREIIWLLNLMNINDKRFPVKESEVFDSSDNFIVDEQGNEIGKDLLIQKSIGYISYVQGENPFTFPYRIWPNNWGNVYSIKRKMENGWRYPTLQINTATIIDPISFLDVLVLPINSYQEKGYNYVLEKTRKAYPILNEPRDGIQYTAIEGLKQALNIVYPHSKIDDDSENIAKLLYGKGGLDRVMLYKESNKSKFKYKEKTIKEFGRIFSSEELPKYSSKISYICEQIKNSKGIVLVYSQYIDGGGIPIALALEEMGFARYGNTAHSLFETPPSEPIDYLSMKGEQETKGDFHQAKYIMITGNDNLSPDKVGDMSAITQPENSDGKNVKVVIISKAGSEGLDFKCIRQIHILEPWYNLNRLDQIVGRGVRNMSHCLLPYHSRNVEIYLYGTELSNNTEESIDLYMYRLAEKKAIKIGMVSRLLKQNATDCLLNKGQTQRSANSINVEVEQRVSSSDTPITYKVGDKDNSLLCDFMTCGFQCQPFDGKINPNDINSDTYDETFIVMNLDKILQRIRQLFKEKYFYEKNELIASINAIKTYPIDQIYSALNYFIIERNEYIVDMLGRIGTLVNINNYYLFQPIELENPNISRETRVVPVDFKRKMLTFSELPNIPGDDAILKNKNDNKKVAENKKNNADIENESVADTGSLLEKLQEMYDDIHNKQFIYSKDKTNWNKLSVWAIENLVIYNEFDKTILERLAFEHCIDTLNYAKKHALCNIIYNIEIQNDMQQQIMDFFEKYKIQKGSNIGIVLANYKSTTGFLQTIIVKRGNKWIKATQRDLLELLPIAYEKFGIKNVETGKILDNIDINTTFGFMTSFSSNTKSNNKNIVYKTKSLRKSNKGRVLGGQVCARGVQKKDMVKQINNILPSVGGTKKYSIELSKARNINMIYGNSDIQQMALKKIGTKGKIIKNPKMIEVKLNTLQLCIELELIYRYYHETNFEGKMWFFSSVYDTFNNIEKISN